MMGSFLRECGGRDRGDRTADGGMAWCGGPAAGLGALATLPQGERDVILLVALGQLSHDEVAQALGISPARLDPGSVAHARSFAA
jgi:sigma-70-like protein